MIPRTSKYDRSGTGQVERIMKDSKGERRKEGGEVIKSPGKWTGNN